MRDAYDAQIWADHHEALTAQISKFIAGIRVGFETLHRIQFDAPWGRNARTRRIGDA